jgi:hypothetical protein
MRPWVVGGACVLAGLVVAAAWTWAQPERHRADARMLVRPASARPAVEALAESSLVAANVEQTLRLSSPPEITAKRGDGGVLTVSAVAGSPERARQIDAEAVVILAQAVERRFATTDVSATTLDPAHAAEQTSPTPGRNFLIGGLAGLVAGIAAAAALSTRRPARAAAGADPRAERRLQQRIDEVAKRERALARRAGELAARERELDGMSSLRREPAEMPEAATHQEPEPVAQPAHVEYTASGPWTLQRLEAFARLQQSEPQRQEEWANYLFFLRDHADADGTLPPAFDDLINEVFGPLPVSQPE